MKTRHAPLRWLLPFGVLAASVAAADDAEQQLRQSLLESDDPSLIAQREHFPEHYEKVVQYLVRIQGDDALDAAEARQRLGQFSARNWNLYTKQVRQATPSDWSRLLELRRDLFDLIDRTHGPYLCHQYEYGGAQVLINADRDLYHGPLGAYISAFIETAARAKKNPTTEEKLEISMADLHELYQTAAEQSGNPHLMAILRPGSLLHSQYCTATVQLLTTALAMEAPLGPRLWRYLVTQPAGR